MVGFRLYKGRPNSKSAFYTPVSRCAIGQVIQIPKALYHFLDLIPHYYDYLLT